MPLHHGTPSRHLWREHRQIPHHENLVAGQHEDRPAIRRDDRQHRGVMDARYALRMVVNQGSTCEVCAMSLACPLLLSLQAEGSHQRLRSYERRSWHVKIALSQVVTRYGVTCRAVDLPPSDVIFLSCVSVQQMGWQESGRVIRWKNCRYYKRS